MSLLALVSLGCGASDAERIGATAGLPFPSSATLVLKEDHCCDFFGDGDMWRIYELEKGATWIDEQNCQEHGFQKGLYEHMRLKISTFAEFIDHEQDWCYKIIKDERQSIKAVMLQQNRIYYYQKWN